MSKRYGVQWPDGSVTGDITDRYRLAAGYGKLYGGKAYLADDSGNPAADQSQAEDTEPEPEIT